MDNVNKLILLQIMLLNVLYSVGAFDGVFVGEYDGADEGFKVGIVGEIVGGKVGATLTVWTGAFDSRFPTTMGDIVIEVDLSQKKSMYNLSKDMIQLICCFYTWFLSSIYVNRFLHIFVYRRELFFPLSKFKKCGISAYLFVFVFYFSTVLNLV